MQLVGTYEPCFNDLLRNSSWERGMRSWWRTRCCTRSACNWLKWIRGAPTFGYTSGSRFDAWAACSWIVIEFMYGRRVHNIEGWKPILTLINVGGPSSSIDWWPDPNIQQATQMLTATFKSRVHFPGGLSQCRFNITEESWLVGEISGS